jgi:hypothetical protein
MRKVQNRWLQGRRNIMLGALVAAGLTGLPLQAFAQAPAQPATPGQGQPPATQPPATQPGAPSPQQAQPATPQPGLTFEGDAGLILMQIKPDKTADFESVMAKLKEALAKSDKPERRQQAAGWKIYKSTDPGPGGNVLYVAVINPVQKGADYTVAKILYEVFPTEVQTIFPTYRDSFAAGLNKVTLQLVQDLGSGAPAATGTPTPTPTGTPSQPGTSTPGTTTPPSSTTPPPQ